MRDLHLYSIEQLETLRDELDFSLTEDTMSPATAQHLRRRIESIDDELTQRRADMLYEPDTEAGFVK